MEVQVVHFGQQRPARAQAPHPNRTTMRFKAGVSHARFSALFAHILMMERVGKMVVCVFSSTTVRFICSSDADSVMLYSVVATPAVFSSFRCESRSDNVIAFEVAVENLLAGLKPGADAEHVTLKLTKRDASQYLRVETTPRDGGVALVQDVPVRVAGAAEMLRFAPPKLPAPTVALFLPPPRVLVAVVDRLKALGRTLRIEALARALDADGADAGATLTLGADADLVNTRTFFRGLLADGSAAMAAAAAAADADDFGGGAAAAGAPAVCCVVSAKDLSRTLHGVAVLAAAHAVQTRIAVVKDIALYFHAHLEDGTGEMTIIHSIQAVEE